MPSNHKNFSSSTKGLRYISMLPPECHDPRMTNVRKMLYSFIHIPGDRLYGVIKTGQYK